MWEIKVLKVIPLVVTFVLTIFLSSILGKRTHDLAVDELILPDANTDSAAHKTLDYLLRWRDLMTATVTGLFVLFFSAIDNLTQNNSITVDTVIFVVVVAVVVMLLLLVAAWFLPNRLGLTLMQSNLWYCILFILFVVTLYVGSFFLIILS